ncbi:glutathionylspermidine synthase YjfC [Escherichia coli]|nr:glutathionylspermidine synthase YjfC [Escherichia coli]
MKTGVPCCTCRTAPQQAGQESRFIYIEDLGLGVGGVLTDLDDNVIQRAFKLYPLEWMMRDDNGPAAAQASRAMGGAVMEKYLE